MPVAIFQEHDNGSELAVDLVEKSINDWLARNPTITVIAMAPTSSTYTTQFRRDYKSELEDTIRVVYQCLVLYTEN